MNIIEFGDCRDIMRRWASEGVKVQTCVTSPPYFGLRDYGVDGQIGLEQTPEEYIAAMVEVFRCVRDVLADDGTLWLNIGDSYFSQTKGDNRTREQKLASSALNLAKDLTVAQSQHDIVGVRKISAGETGCKTKDLIGIPWALAKALRDPYYTGPVKDVCDQVWLAAMLDAEGSICGTEYQTGDRIKTNIYISITNTSVPVIEKCDRLFPQDLKHIYEKTNGASNRKCFRWDVERMDQKALFLRTIYPHLVAKRKQAIIGYTFIEMQRGLVSKKKGYLAEQHEQRSWLMQALSLLNSGQDVDIPDWCFEPPSLFEPGYYLRQDIIWHKPNPMPESVRDRCTKAHEYIFLLSKSERYFFDSEAMKEPAAYPPGTREDVKKGGFKSKYAGDVARKGDESFRAIREMRNKRSVWTVATRPYKGAHFATFPPALIEPCILAGSRAGDIVLDPFMGSGTTAQVAFKQGRKYLGCELNPSYAELQNARLQSAFNEQELWA